jgi:hypothetical protein
MTNSPTDLGRSACHPGATPRSRSDELRFPKAYPWVLRLQAVLLAAKREGFAELEGIGRSSRP